MEKYYVLGKDFDFLREAFDVYNDTSPIIYISKFAEVIGATGVWFNEIFARISFLPLISRVFRRWIYSRMIIVPKDTEVYLLVSTDWFSFVEKGYALYFKKRYPEGKIVAYFTDNANKYTWLDIDNLWWSDWTITYNPKDVEERHWGFFMDVNTKIYKNLPEKRVEYESDIFFCGSARDRLDKLHHCYEYFNNMGLRCEFYITNVPRDLQLKDSNIIYNEILPYKEVQRKSAFTRCILEISDTDANGFTYRIEEAMMYNTKVITDVDFVKHTDFFNPKGMFCYTKIEDVTKEWIMCANELDYHYDDFIGINELLKLIKNHFSNHQEYPCTKWQVHSDEYIKQLCQF